VQVFASWLVTAGFCTILRDTAIREKKVFPSRGEFIAHHLEPWAKATSEKSSPKTWLDWSQHAREA